MAGILQSVWIDKRYPVEGRTFHFLIAVSSINLLNALCKASGNYDWAASFDIVEHSRTHWTATEKNGDTTYELFAQEARPEIPECDPMAIQDLRMPETQPRKAGPKQLSFF